MKLVEEIEWDRNLLLLSQDTFHRTGARTRPWAARCSTIDEMIVVRVFLNVDT